MYKVILAEDEMLVRLGLLNAVKWGANLPKKFATKIFHPTQIQPRYILFSRVCFEVTY